MPPPPDSIVLQGEPHVLFPRESLGVIVSQIHRTLGQGGESILYSAGRETGAAQWTFVKKLFEPGDADEIVEAFGRHFRDLGQFDTLASSIDADEHRVILSLDRSFEAVHSEARDHRRGCHYIRGLVAGFFESALGSAPLVCREMRCQSRGDTECELVAVPEEDVTPTP